MVWKSQVWEEDSVVPVTSLAKRLPFSFGISFFLPNGLDNSQHKPESHSETSEVCCSIQPISISEIGDPNQHFDFPTCCVNQTSKRWHSSATIYTHIYVVAVVKKTLLKRKLNFANQKGLAKARLPFGLRPVLLQYGSDRAQLKMVNLCQKRY